MKVAAVLAIAVAGTTVVAGSAAVLGMRAPANAPAVQPVWTEAKWPFPMDQWGVGKAFACARVDCAAKIEVYVRPKIGFCNCSTGVADDTELERVADTGLVSAQVRPLERGRPIKVGWMTGLSRAYAVSRAYVDAGAADQRLLSVAFNDECDVVVATAALGSSDPAVMAPAVLSFLNSRPMVLWAKKELGLEFVSREW